MGKRQVPILNEFYNEFCSQLDSHIEKFTKANDELDGMSREEINLNSEEQILCETKLSTWKTYFSKKKADLDNILKKLKNQNETLKKQRKDCEEKFRSAHEDLILELEGKEIINVEKSYGDIFNALLESVDSLSSQSMNHQLIDLRKTLESLNNDKNRLSDIIKNQENEIKLLNQKLKSSYGVSYKERNVLRYSLLYQAREIRHQYRKIRLLEDSLKAKLSI